jgi:hypothetical protein
VKLSRDCTLWCLGIFLLVSIFAAQAATATGVLVAGTYEIIGKSDLGSNVKVALRLRLKSQESSPLFLQGSVLSDFAYPHCRGALASEVVLRPGVTQQAVEQSVVPRAEYDQWKRGLRPRVDLELRTGTGAKITEILRLEPLSEGKGE